MGEGHAFSSHISALLFHAFPSPSPFAFSASLASTGLCGSVLTSNLSAAGRLAGNGPDVHLLALG